MQGTRGRRRRRLTPIALAAGVLGSAVLGLGATGTYSSLTATITNSSNSASAGGLVMQQTDDTTPPVVRCTSNQAGSTDNSATCATPNVYGGSTTMTPGGDPVVTKIRIYDTGSVDPGAFTLAPGACTSSPQSSSSICSQLKLTLTCTPMTGSTSGTPFTVYNAASLSSITANGQTNVVDLTNSCLPLKNSGTYALLTFRVQLASGAGNDVQGQTATQQLVWQFTTGT